MESILYLLENEFQGSQSPEFHPSPIFCAWRFLSRHMKYRSYKNDNIFYLTTCQWLYIFIDHTIARYIRIYSNIYSPECKEKQNTHLDQEEMIYLKRNYFLFMLDEYTKWIDGAFGGRLAAERKRLLHTFHLHVSQSTRDRDRKSRFRAIWLKPTFTIFLPLQIVWKDRKHRTKSRSWKSTC